MTDRELGLSFFYRLAEKGFEVEIKDFQGLSVTDKDYDGRCISVSLKDYRDKTFISFDFLGDEFYRVSGYDSTGGWSDEVDGKKYT